MTKAQFLDKFQPNYFRIFDKDEDGKLSVPELKQIMSSLGEKMAGRYSKIKTKWPAGIQK